MQITRVNSNVMRLRADQLRQEAKNVGALMASLKQLSDSVQLEWQCEHSRAFGEWYSSTMRPSLTAGQSRINDLAFALDEGAEREGRDCPHAAVDSSRAP